jgi:hypothetical protein
MSAQLYINFGGVYEVNQLSLITSLFDADHKRKHCQRLNFEEARRQIITYE